MNTAQNKKSTFKLSKKSQIGTSLYRELKGSFSDHQENLKKLLNLKNIDLITIGEKDYSVNTYVLSHPDCRKGVFYCLCTLG